MAKATKWVECTNWLSQTKQPERNDQSLIYNLGPTANLQALGRKAMYRTAIFAGLCGVSERTLERLMKSNYPSSPSSWLRTLQILDSIPLICRGKRIKAVAAEVYFQNPTDFSRAFRRLVGYTPTQFYREWMQNGRKPVG